MRVASFRVTGQDGKQADVSVIPLPGEAGTDLSNVNRWRSQVEQEPVSEPELRTLAQPVEVDGQPATLYEQNGQNSAGDPTRILAVIQRRDGTAWFFKMTGDSQLVAQQKPAFVALLRSIQFTTAGSATAQSASPGLMTDGSLPAGHPDISMPPPDSTAMTPSTDRPKWVVPDGWQEAPAGQFLVAKYSVAGEGGAQAAVNISSSAGNGGGVAANVNRWRKQLGLEALSDDELSKSMKTVPTSAGTATFVEMSGQDARSGQPAALVAAIVVQPGYTWFYKLMGDGTVVTAQKDAFTRFVQDVNY